MAGKNSKTILFATLIVAMILPFSTMNAASGSDGATDIEEINSAIATYLQAIENADSEQRTGLQKSPDRLVIAKEIIITSEQSDKPDEGYETEQLRLEKINNLTRLLEDTYPKQPDSENVTEPSGDVAKSQGKP